MYNTAMPTTTTWHRLLRQHLHPTGARHRQHAWEAGNWAGKGETLGRRACALARCSVSRLTTSSGTLRSVPSRSACPEPSRLPLHQAHRLHQQLLLGLWLLLPERPPNGRAVVRRL